jgi:large subunit ribosomal protein L6
MVDIPDGVKVIQKDKKLTFTGPKGTLDLNLNQKVTTQLEESGKKLKVLCDAKTAQEKAIHGTYRSLINNAVIGVQKGYEKKIEIHGVGYNTKVQGQEIILVLGYSHPVKMIIPKGLNVTCPNPNTLVIEGVDKELVGHFAFQIRDIKPCEPYNLKGIKYADEVIKKKAGKTFVSGAS